ncbi:hypothetical protein PSAB6_150069 [Paraburkholderia sabiae]|nr:hypothetical protein PSAB6_150069 [Paraburkholderia sabiae]
MGERRKGTYNVFIFHISNIFEMLHGSKPLRQLTGAMTANVLRADLAETAGQRAVQGRRTKPLAR